MKICSSEWSINVLEMWESKQCKRFHMEDKNEKRGGKQDKQIERREQKIKDLEVRGANH